MHVEPQASKNSVSHSADVTQASFDEQVLKRSQHVPVLVDFWASWCGPCRMLAPILTKLAEEYQGKFFLAKVDADAEPPLANRYGVRSLPTVKVFKNGEVVDEFFGAQPERIIRALLDRHLPREADGLVDQALAALKTGQPEQALALLKSAVEKDPGHDRAKLALAQQLAASSRLDDSEQLLNKLSLEAYNKPEAQALLGQLALLRCIVDAPPVENLVANVANQPDNTLSQFQLAVRRILHGEPENGLAQLLEIVKQHREFQDDAARKAMLASFQLLGDQDERVKKYRQLLSLTLH